MSTPEFVDYVHELILANWFISAKTIAKRLQISKKCVAGFIIDELLGLKKISTKWVPKCLNSNQKQYNKVDFAVFTAI